MTIYETPKTGKKLDSTALIGRDIFDQASSSIMQKAYSDRFNHVINYSLMLMDLKY